MDDHGLRERAVTTHWEPPVHGLKESMWTARDPETGCTGLGRVEAEAYGNLAAAVHHYEDEGSTTGYTKYPGTLRRRPMGDPGREEGSGLLEWLAGAFRRDRD
ncbi:MAG: hypothetical protein V5A62_05565 [Haloarculaceae archaeon]